MTVLGYDKLKKLIVLSISENVRHNYLLDMIKEFYKEEINSPRRFEKITSIEDLLDVLEVRNKLTEDDVSPLVEIANRIPNSKEILKKVDAFKRSRSIKEHSFTSFNSVCDEVSHSLQQQPKIMLFEILNSSIWHVSERKWERLRKTITEEIGSEWKSFARFLDTRENEIDEINNTCKTTDERATAILENYIIRKAEPQRWFYDLCQALDHVRRKDLSRTLQQIMLMKL